MAPKLRHLELRPCGRFTQHPANLPNGEEPKRTPTSAASTPPRTNAAMALDFPLHPFVLHGRGDLEEQNGSHWVRLIHNTHISNVMNDITGHDLRRAPK